MTAVLAWLALELRRRWRSLAVLTLLVAVAAGTVMAATAGARRATTALERLNAPTLPGTVAVLANTPGFDWDRVRAMPEVESLSTFAVDYAIEVEGIPGNSIGFPHTDDAVLRTIERPIVLAGRVLDPRRADEVVVSRKFVQHYHKGVGDTVVIRLPTPQELAGSAPGQTPALHGPRVTARIVGVVASPWFSDAPDSDGSVLPSPGLAARYPANVIGDQTRSVGLSFINALIRLEDPSETGIARFRERFNQVSSRSDIDIWNLPQQQREIQRHIDFEAQCLLAFALAVLVAAVFLVGQAIVRYAADGVADLRTLHALGMTRAQAVAAAAAGPTLAAAVGGLLGAVAAAVASARFPINTAAYYEPAPGIRPDWPVLAAGVLLVLALALAGSAGAARLALRPAPDAAAARRSAVVVLLSRAGVSVPVLIGSRFALERGRGRTAVPVRPALLGAVTGVVGVVGVLTFSQGVTDAGSNPARFGQTYQLASFLGINGNDFGPVLLIRDALARSRDVTGVNDARTAVATGADGRGSVSLWTYTAGAKPVPVVVTAGRMATAPDEVVLGPRTLAALHKAVGDRVALVGSRSPEPVTFRITGAGLVPSGPHNGYADGGWISGPGFDSLFTGYKFRAVLVTLRPGADPAVLARTLVASVVKAVPAAGEMTLDVPEPLTEVTVLRQVRSMPVALGSFLALLAIGAVGHALATAVRRRSLDIAVLRALGMTRWQSRGVVVVQASLLALVGLLFGVPLGAALGRTLWRVVADYTPLQYVAPVAVLALLLIGPLTLVVANALAAWPGRQVTRLRIGHVLRAE